MAAEVPCLLAHLPHLGRALGLSLALAVVATFGVGPNLASSGKAAFASEPCQETTVTARAQADAWIDQDGAFSNKGSDAVMTVRSVVPDKNARILIRFPLSTAPPPGCVVEVAKLRLFAVSGDDSRRLEAARLAFAWSENLVTWSDQPGTVGAPATTWAGEGYIQWNVTSQVEAMLEGANHGFLIRDEAENDEAGGEQGFHSREKGESDPELVIRFAAPKTGEPPGPPAPPMPAAVRCGQELLQSTLVTNDLRDCPGDGLVIGDEGIIVDLGGHTIDGVGLGTGVRNDGYDLVTVRNGMVQEFDFGVQLLPKTDLNLVERLSLRQNQIGAIELSDAGAAGAGNEVRANLIEQNGDGIALIKGTTASLVTGNTMALNSGSGLLVSQSDGNRLEGNSVGGSGDLGIGLEHASGNTVVDNSIASNSDGGIEIVEGSNGNRVEDNMVSLSGDTGILVGESDRNELIDNTTELMSDSGITLNAANDGLVRGNDVRFNSGGIQADGSSRNLFETNNASESTGIGIELGGGSLENDVVRNVVGDNGSEGIYLSDEATDGLGNLVERNVASGNSGDGIATGKGGHILSFNVANENGGLGISAAPGTIDGGGNVALNNRKPEKCAGIVCNADATPQDTSIGSGPPDPSNSRSVSFSFTGEDAGTADSALRFECRLDGAGAAWVACTSPKSYTELADGPHSFEVRAVDQAGNFDPSPATYTWTIDATAPETSISDRPADTSNSRSATFNFSGEDDRTAASGLRFECRFDDEGFTGCASPKAYSELADGERTFEVRSVDQAGNFDPSPATYTWTIDATAPVVSVVASGSGSGFCKGTVPKGHPRFPPSRVALIVKAPMVERGERVVVRLWNGTGRAIRYGDEYRLQRFDGQYRVSEPPSDGLYAPPIRRALLPGTATPCLRVRISVEAPPGRYWFLKQVYLERRSRLVSKFKVARFQVQ